MQKRKATLLFAALLSVSLALILLNSAVITPHLELQASNNGIISSAKNDKLKVKEKSGLPHSSEVDPTNSLDIFSPNQHHTYYANGRHWVWFSSNGYVGYSSSTDAVSWSNFTPVTSTVASTFTIFDVFFDGTYVHYVISRGWNDPIRYCRGIPNSDGTIGWNTEQVVLQGFPDTLYGQFSISVDSNGCPWIGYLQYKSSWSNGQTPNPFYPYVVKSSTNNGTWITAEGFPFRLSEETLGDRIVTLVPLTQGKMYAVYSSNFKPLKGRLWNGLSFGNEETITVSNLGTCWFYSAVANGDDVHLVFLNYYMDYPPDYPSNIIYVKRDYVKGAWSSEIKIPLTGSLTFLSAPALSINTANGVLYCFWATMDYKTGKPHIYYSRNINGKWDATPTDWITATNELINYDGLTTFYNAYDNKIGLAYLTWTVDNNITYYVKYNYLVL
jgi:hypothetical protein